MEKNISDEVISATKEHTTTLNHAYWRRKLPRGFTFYIERLTRGIIRVQPSNIPQFAAVFMEEILVQRNCKFLNGNMGESVFILRGFYFGSFILLFIGLFLNLSILLFVI